MVNMSNNDIFNMHFGIIDNPRCKVNVTHKLVDILKLVMIAVLCDMDELDKITDYVNNKKKSLKSDTFLFITLKIIFLLYIAFFT